jgi:soluble lytic murein transglycosylase-like protein
MKAICIATVLAVVSTPALAREAHAVVTGTWQPFGEATAVSERWDVQARAPSIALDASPSQGAYAEMVARHAAANGVPVSLVHRVIMRESRYNPRAISKGNYGIMQIRLSTARAMGYAGTASGLLDPEINMAYAVKYLAGAYKTAGGSESGAVANYARGYYHQATRRGLSPYEAPGAAAFAMEPSARDIRIGQMNSDASGRMMADRHMAF